MNIASRLDAAKLLQLLDENGPIALSLPGFEARQEQRSMMQNVIDAFNKRQIALIEAGTGTGKSMAYLIPAMVAALQFQEKVVISTNTISLQEQLLYKDIPLLFNALNLPLKAVLVKGMNNYICLRKLEELAVDKLFLSKNEQEEIEKIELSLQDNIEGSRSKLPFITSQQTWEHVGAEHVSCNNQECPHYLNCYFFKARKEALDANLLIVNHHLLFSDLAMRAETNNWSSQAVLPFFDRLILDEAHNIEDIATDYFASRLSRLDILRLLGRLNAEKPGGKSFGKLPLLKEKLTPFVLKEPSKNFLSLINSLTIDLPALRRDLIKSLSDTFHSYHQFIQKVLGEEEFFEEGKLRLLQNHFKCNEWNNDVAIKSKDLSNQIRKYAQVLSSLEDEIKDLNSDKLLEQTKALRFEIKALSKRLEEASKTLDEFILHEDKPNQVRWVQSESFRGISNTSLINANLDISKLLVRYLFDKFGTIILCSATLACNQKFEFLRSRLGLGKENLRVTENRYESPFDFSKQALLLIPQNLPSPVETHFIEEASKLIFNAIVAARGNAFVLFTSYAMLQSCANLLSEKLKTGRFPLFQQGQESRKKLIDNFKKTPRAVLFGTDSFWEGIDVVGDALRCVIIAKLPFRVPSDPLLEARAEALTARGEDPFFEYFLPAAIVKFKQGFGRLIRTKKDRGCIVCLDTRIVNKGYGKFFLNSLPNCQKIIAPTDQLQKYMIDFYKN